MGAMGQAASQGLSSCQPAAGFATNFLVHPIALNDNKPSLHVICPPSATLCLERTCPGNWPMQMLLSLSTSSLSGVRMARPTKSIPLPWYWDRSPNTEVMRS